MFLNPACLSPCGHHRRTLYICLANGENFQNLSLLLEELPVKKSQPVSGTIHKYRYQSATRCVVCDAAQRERHMLREKRVSQAHFDACDLVFRAVVVTAVSHRSGALQNACSVVTLNLDFPDEPDDTERHTPPFEKHVRGCPLRGSSFSKSAHISSRLVPSAPHPPGQEATSPQRTSIRNAGKGGRSQGVLCFMF